jgi:ABC-type polysaccharide/polyol phosphate transport system ATPase subunit
VSSEPVIRAEGIWKRYGVPLAWTIERSFRRDTTRDAGGGRGPWALADVSFELGQGEVLGVMGRNGAGKSTLLKVLCGVTPPTRGSVQVRGRIFPMLELNAGVHPELTGRENARLLSAVVGLDRAETERHLPDIESFCDIGEWFDQPVRKYSSGMLARLGFAVAMNVDADILLIDEVLAVGDLAFQKKCVAAIAERTRGDTSAVFVSHNPYLVERMCDRVLMLGEGHLEVLGEPREVVSRYFELGVDDLEGGPVPLPPPDQRAGTGDVRVDRLEILDGDGRPTPNVWTDGPVTFRIHYRAPRPLKEPNFTVRLYDPQNTIVLSLAATQERYGWEMAGEGFVDCHLERLPLMPNVYLVQIKLGGEVTYDLCETAGKLAVRARPEDLVASGGQGMTYARAAWTHRPG